MSKSQWSFTSAEYVLLFSEFHDLKTEASMSCKELSDKHCPLVQYRKTGNIILWNTILYFNITVLSKISFTCQPEIIYDRIICSFAISLSYPRTHPLSLFLFSFICSWLSKKPLQQLLTIPSVCCYLCTPLFGNNRALYIKFGFCFEKRLFLVYFKNDFKIF